MIITAHNASATYGDASATFNGGAPDYTITGVVSGDSVGTITCSTGYTQYEGAGTYSGATSCSGAVNANYSFT
ncbi:MAG TPA: MBG domain-containing protein, partial [Acidimicrobiales bacterium]|nr:MBG domain-containing protein [Acidimicrobiales bacterium]